MLPHREEGDHAARGARRRPPHDPAQTTTAPRGHNARVCTCERARHTPVYFWIRDALRAAMIIPFILWSLILLADILVIFVFVRDLHGNHFSIMGLGGDGEGEVRDREGVCLGGSRTPASAPELAGV